ncbi:MAG: matrixin family metalloprotease [Clostridia bacterium]|nr:matrixin family metalloprotease [Clostridia bacterium]
MKFKHIIAVSLCLTLLTALACPSFSDDEITLDITETIQLPTEDNASPDTIYDYAMSGVWFPYRLRGGIENRMYYVGVSSAQYVNASHNAITAWNNICEPTANYDGDFEFTETTNLSNASIRFWAEDEEWVTWKGQTRFIMPDGTVIVYDDEDPNNNITEDWIKASCVYNTWHVRNDPEGTHLPSIACHEVGHAVGLAHRTISDDYVSVLQKWGRQALTPTALDGLTLSIRYSTTNIELNKLSDETECAE